MLVQDREARWNSVIKSKYPAFDNADISTLNKPEDQAAEWLKTTRGTNLLLLGPVGSGKTYTAFALLKQRYVDGEKVELRNVPRMLDDLRRTQNTYPSPLDELCRADLLLLDDFGAKRLSEWGQDQLYLILAERHMRNLATVFTANFNVEDLRDELDPRLFSRIMHHCMVVYLTGSDRRLA